jgi:hypothetical protein
VVDGVLQFTLVAMAPRSDGLLGDSRHNITDRCSEGWPLVPAEDPGSGEDLCSYLEFHPSWTRDFLDPISWGGGDAQVSQQGTKPAGRDRGFNTETFRQHLYTTSHPRCHSGESTLHCQHRGPPAPATT